MHLIQQRQVQGLFEDIGELKIDALSGRNNNYDLHSEDQWFTGKKTFVDDATFWGKVQIQTSDLSFDFSLSGDAYIAPGEKFYYGNTNLYVYAQNDSRLVVSSQAYNASGEIYLTSTSGIALAAPFLDLDQVIPEIRVAQSDSALTCTVEGLRFLTLDTAITTDVKLGLGHTGAPQVTLDITGTQFIDSLNTSSRVLKIGNSGGREVWQTFDYKGGESRIGVGTDGPLSSPTLLSGFYVQAQDEMPLYLGHVSKQAIRIDSTGSMPRVRIGEYKTRDRPSNPGGAVLTIENTGDTSGPMVVLYNDKPSPLHPSNCGVRFVENNLAEHAAGNGGNSWELGHHDDLVGYMGNNITSSFRLAFITGNWRHGNQHARSAYSVGKSSRSGDSKNSGRRLRDQRTKRVRRCLSRGRNFIFTKHPS